MDPLSIISSIAGILIAIPGLIKAIQSSAAYIDDFVKGPKLVDELNSDIFYFTYLIETLRSFLQDKYIVRLIQQEWANQILNGTERTLMELQHCLKKAGQQDGTRIQIHRLGWLRVEAECRRLRTRLGNHQMKLNGLIGVVKMKLLYVRCRGDPQYLALCAAEVGELTRQTTCIDLELTDGEKDLTRLSVSSTLVEGSQSNLTTATGIVSDTAALLGTQVEEEQSSLAVEASETISVLQEPGDKCGCECHSKFLRRLSIFKNRCSNFECCIRKPRFRRTHVISLRWLQKIVKNSVMAADHDFTYCPTVRNCIAEGSEANTYAKNGNLKGLKKLIESGLTTPYDKTPDGWTLLHAGAYYGQLEIVQYVLKLGADINVYEIGTRKPSDLARVRALNVNSSKLQKQIAAEFPDAEDFAEDTGLTPIHVALLGLYEHGDKARPSLDSLLKFAEEAENAPAETNWKHWRLQTLQKFAEEAKPAEEAENESATADWNRWGLPDRDQSPLFREIVAQYRFPDCSRLINRADEKYGWTPFLWAAYTGRKAGMETLIDHGADPFKLSKMERNALHLAAESKIPEVMEYILEIPNDYGESFDVNHPDRWRETPLHVAASGSPGCVKLLLEKYARRDARQENQQVPLHYATLAPKGQDKYKIVDLLSLDAETSVNAQDEEGKSPIFLLVDSPECVELLISRGADIGLLDSAGKSVFHYACIEDHMESLKVLIDRSTVQQAISFDLISLAWYGSPSCARLLVQRDAFGSFHGKDGWSLVHHAARWGNPEVLEAVLKHPTFRRGSKTPLGDSAADIARAHKNWTGRCKELLLKYDSKGKRPAGYVTPPVLKEEALQAEARFSHVAVMR